MAGMHLIAARGDELALRVGLERAVARVGGRAVGHLHLEEALAVDGDVLRVAGLLQVALRVEALGRDLCTPVPSWMPDGSSVCCVEFAPGWRMVWYSRSSNTAREPLKPLVLTLARLFEITSICDCCAFMPVAAM